MQFLECLSSSQNSNFNIDLKLRWMLAQFLGGALSLKAARSETSIILKVHSQLPDMKYVRCTEDYRHNTIKARLIWADSSHPLFQD